ncbi:MAG: DUF3775 domain-containing protein [Gammaproteobacteria bacterium]|jgi:hypothetical protein
MDINPETVCYLIQKARAFHVKEGVSIPEEPMNSSEDWALQVLAGHAGDPTYQEFIMTVRDLEPDQQANLVALMWMGRGEYEPEEWDAALRRAKSEMTPQTAEYLIAKPYLADYLLEGLDLLGYSCEE